MSDYTWYTPKGWTTTANTGVSVTVTNTEPIYYNTNINWTDICQQELLKSWKQYVNGIDPYKKKSLNSLIKTL